MTTWSERAKGLRDTKDVDELEKKYDELCEYYDEGNHEPQYLSNAPYETARAVIQLEPNRNVKILDVGCGTGLVGEELFREGYQNIHGVDMSAGMLKMCKKKNVYSKLVRARFGPSEPLEYVNGYFDVVMSCGTFVPGAHLNQTCLPELFRLLKPGGYMVIATRQKAFEEELGGLELKSTLPHLVEEGVLAKLSHDVIRYTTEINIDIPGVILSYILLPAEKEQNTK
ncbi:methyltransferase-like protein 27 [Lytechinus pictus]|uniref:methyltransferase-like protein 27 n=1 Tax=Lytechinus pictus TaxID=7653 RepID=UPI0030BA1E2F